MKASSDKNQDGIAARLRAYRLKFELSQEKAADMFAIPFSTYKRYESGTNEPSSEAIAGMTQAGMNANWLLMGKGEMLLENLVPRGRYDGDIDNTSFKANEPTVINKLLQDLSAKQQDLWHIEIDGVILGKCLEACRKSYGDGFNKISVDQQLGYACNLYNSLVRLSAAEGRTIVDFKHLEMPTMIAFMNAFIAMGWAKKFPPAIDPFNKF